MRTIVFLKQFFSRSVLWILFLGLSIGVMSAKSKAEQTINGSAWTLYGSRDYQITFPKNYKPNQAYPLVIAMHGCLQNSKAFAGGARLEKFANDYEAIILMPDQQLLANPYKCWNWFYPINQDRSGEPAIIMNMLEKVKTDYLIDTQRVFAMGMSAGGATANTLGNCYPETFKAIASHHGIQYNATENPMLAQDVFYRGPKISPKRAADKGYRCQGGVPKKTTMPALTIQGTRGIMDPSNSVAIENQFLFFNDLLHNGKFDQSLGLVMRKTTTQTEADYDYDTYSWVDLKGQRIVERVEIVGLGHSWSGGDSDYDWNDPKGPDATALIFEFFRHHGL